MTAPGTDRIHGRVGVGRAMGDRWADFGRQGPVKRRSGGVFLATLTAVVFVAAFLASWSGAVGARHPVGYRLAGAEGPGEWPTFHHDAARTGYAPEETTLQPPLRLKWSYVAAGAVWAPLVTAGGMVFAVSADGTLHSLVAGTGTPKWSFQRGSLSQTSDTASPSLAGGVLYQGADDGSLYALDPGTGRTLWSYSTGAPIRSTPAVVGGTVYLTSGTKLYALDSRTGTLKWTYSTGQPIRVSPAVADGMVYAAFSKPIEYTTGSEIVALEAATGIVKWTALAPYASGQSPAAADGLVYFSVTAFSWFGDYGYVKALDAQTGVEKWSYSFGFGVYSSPAVANGVVYVGANDLRVHALDATTGSPRWIFTTGSSISSSPAVANGVVYIGSNDGKVYGLDALTGDLRWKYDTGAPVRSSPAVADGTLYVGSDNGQVYAFESQSIPPSSIPNLSVMKISGKDQAYPGDALAYLIFLDNSGSTGISVALTDTLPPGLSYITDSVSGGATYSPTINSVLWSGIVPAGDSSLPSRVFQFWARVDEGFAERAITNTVQVTNGTVVVAASARTEIWRLQAFLPSLAKGEAW